MFGGLLEELDLVDGSDQVGGLLHHSTRNHFPNSVFPVDVSVSHVSGNLDPGHPLGNGTWETDHVKTSYLRKLSITTDIATFPEPSTNAQI